MSIRKGNTILSGLGSKGVSPTATVSKDNNITTITITDENGTTTATINDTNVVANPTLVGSENALEGLQIDSIKYKSIYPIDLKLAIEIEKKIVSTTQFGDPENATQYGVTNAGTFWLTALEPNMVGKKLKSVTVKTRDNNKKLTLMGSTVQAGSPNENRNTLSALAVTTNQDASTKPIVELNTVAGVHKYLLDGTDPNVTIVTQDYVNSCPSSVGLTRTSDTTAFYYNLNMPENGYGYYWNGTGNLVTERLGLIFEYEEDALIPTNTLELELNNDTKLTCDLPGSTPIQWKNITIDFMGDSITNGYPSSSVSKTYCELLAEKLNSTANVYGVNASTLANGSDPMYSRVLNMDTSADLIFIFGGTNDFALQSRVLGNQFTVSNNTRTLNTDTSTFYGGLNQLCLNLLSTFPNANYILLTPLHRKNYESQITDLQANSAGLYLDEYVECIKKVGEWFSIPVIDLYSESGLYPQDATQQTKYFVGSSDGLHPNQEGHKVIANYIYEQLKSIHKK